MSAETTKSYEDVPEIMRLGSLATGTIDPSTRVKGGEISDDCVNALAREIDEHYIWVNKELIDGTTLIPRWCVDGRKDVKGLPTAPNAAGGTYTLVVAEALIDAPELVQNEATHTSAKHGRAMFSALHEQGHDIGGHIDDHSPEGKCGCGACDRLADIIEFIGNNIEAISEIASTLGLTVSPDLQQKIKANAELLIENKYVSSGDDMISAITKVTVDDNVQKLHGEHKEVVLAVNTKTGTTLDRASVASTFGEDLQAFNVDVWAIENGVRTVTDSNHAFTEKTASAILYNIATACVLAGPSLRVVVVD